MNDKNLIPLNKRTKNEQREIAKRGGIKSGEARRKNKQIKQIVTELLQGEPDGIETIGLFIPDGTTRAALLVGAMYDKARQGDVKAFETLMKYSGNDPDQKRKDAELKIKREMLQLQKQRFVIDNEIEEPVKVLFDIPKNE